jgi:hypothetical protein
MRYNKDPDDMEEMWTYTEDDPSLTVYNILVDTMVKGYLEFYILYSNGLMKQFSTKVRREESYSDTSHDIDILETGKIFNIVANEKKEGAGSGGGGKGSSGGSSKLNLYNTMKQKANFVVANRILYCPIGIIDLSATTVVDKFFTGFKIEHSFIYGGNWNTEELQDIIISTNQAKIGLVYEGWNNGTCKLATFPLLNSRVLPTFNNKCFFHPIIPRVTVKEEICSYTSVFTIQLDDVHDATQTKFKLDEWNKFTISGFPLNKPGIILKYFNGFEERITLEALTGDKFLNILKFN